jgi:hypothetical protein
MERSASLQQFEAEDRLFLIFLLQARRDFSLPAFFHSLIPPLLSYSIQGHGDMRQFNVSRIPPSAGILLL